MKLSSLVDPQHPVVSRLAAEVAAEADASARGVLTEVCNRLSGWRMLARLGPTDYHEVAAERAGNCIDFASIACAVQRRLGVASAYVLLGATPQTFPALMHTWMVTASADGQWFLVDPRDWCVKRSDPDDIENELTVSALFNDDNIAMSAPERRRVWAPES